MTATNGDLLYTKVLKKEKSDSLRDQVDEEFIVE